VDRILADAAIFQGVQPSAVDAVTSQLRPVEFPAGHVFFLEGQWGHRLYIIMSGKVKIGSRSQVGEHICSR
jgi:CRP/FNR family transcriptional regulator, cyclic AMP receptor protein